MLTEMSYGDFLGLVYHKNGVFDLYYTENDLCLYDFSNDNEYLCKKNYEGNYRFTLFEIIYDEFIACIVNFCILRRLLAGAELPIELFRDYLIGTIVHALVHRN